MGASDQPLVERSRAYRILLVDDDASLLFTLATRLQLAGYEVLTAGDGNEALQLIERRGLPHLAIVDIMMPVMDGIAFCEEVQQFSDLPTIMLTAIDTEEVVVDSIGRFAEDYIVKPFSLRQLEVRVERVLRRVGDFAYTLDPIIRVDDLLSIDLAHQQAHLSATVIPLTSTETKLLYLLMRNAGHVVTTDFLMRRLWPMDEIFEDSLRVHIFNLRRKIEPDPRKPRYLLTERGHGYRFVSPAGKGAKPEK